MILGPCASQPISAFCACLVSIMPTPCVCGASSSSCPEYRSSSPVDSGVCPACVHLTSLMPKTASLFLLISAATCAVFPASYMVRTFQDPILIILVERRVVGDVASSRLSPLRVMFLRSEDPSSSGTEFSKCSLFDVFVTDLFLQVRVVSPELNHLGKCPLSAIRLAASLSGKVPSLCGSLHFLQGSRSDFGPPRVFDFPGTYHIWWAFPYPPPGEALDGRSATPHETVASKRRLYIG